ncbi:DUF1573 domain-containing protein [bacterium]|nr:DUF1573 domain-containing protein [candidate division CSSED10-310 bacterium]
MVLSGCSNSGSGPDTGSSDPGSPGHSGANPRLALDVTHFNFGHHLTGDIIEHRIAFKNAGSADLVIHRAMGVGSHISVDVPHDPVPPGQGGDMIIRFDTRGQSGDQHRRVVILSNDPAEPRQYITFSVTIELLLGIEPRRVWFGTVSGSQPTAKSFVISGERVSDVQPAAVRCQPGDNVGAGVSFTVEDTRKTTSGGITVHVTMDTPLFDPGPFNIPVDVFSGLPELDPMSIVLTGTVAGPVGVEPSRLYFGRYEPGTPMTQTVRLRCEDGRMFRILQATTDQSMFSVNTIPADSAVEQTVDVIFTADTDADPRNRGVLTIETDLSKHNVVSVPLYAFRKVIKNR